MKLFKYDHNIWSRVGGDYKFFFKITFPLWVLSFLILYIFLKSPEYYELLVISGLLSYWISSIITLFTLPPHWRLPEDTDDDIKRLVYFLHFAVVSFGFYVVTVGVLQHYYPFFEDLSFHGLRDFKLEIKSYSK